MTDPRADVAWLNTYTGRKFRFLDPCPEDIVIEDIAAGLAHEARYAGQTRVHYSVAAHSVCALRAVQLCGGTLDEQRWALLHDAAEAYVKDVPWPILASGLASDLKAVEKRIMSVIAAKFGLSPIDPPLVKEIDLELLDVESSALLTRHPDWVVARPARPARREVRDVFDGLMLCLVTADWRSLFLSACDSLGLL